MPTPASAEHRSETRPSARDWIGMRATAFAPAGSAAQDEVGPATAVRVAAPGRLHLGFLDPAGTLGRRFGSLGLVIDGWATELELAPARPGALADELCADDAEAEAELPRASAHLQRLRERSGRSAPLALRLRRVLPPHAGFGSGTQLALALGQAFSRLHGLKLSVPEVAQWLGRGLRSGIGIAGFETGGLLVDGGPGRDGQPARPLARLALPADWRVIVVLQPGCRGLSGEAERAALARLAPLPQSAAADLCHQVLMRVLPGAAGDDFALFASGVNRLQQVLGDHFAPAQGGSAWTSEPVGRVFRWWGAQSAAGDAPLAAIGQSSWGPTGFAIVPDAAAGERLIARAQAAGVVDPALQLRLVSPAAQGARIHTRALG